MPAIINLNPKYIFATKKYTERSKFTELSWEGTKPTACILIHGMTGTPHEMKFLGNFLSKKGYPVICPRLKNHGAPISVLKYTKWQEFYQSAREAVRQAQKKYQSIFVGGLSMGALLALLLADEFPNFISGITCLSPTLFYDGWNTPKSKFLLPLAYVTPLKYISYFKEDPPYGIKNEAIRKIVHRYYSRAKLSDLSGVEQYGYPFFPVTLLEQLQLLVKHLIPKLKNITMPIQLIQAEQDDMTSVKNSQFIYDRVGSSIKEMVLLKNSYHVITADQERDTVGENMEQFFTRISR
ncbi:MAG: alpha/beta fold hydrolase [Candidatus Omnitrophica bacterium]|nr:alpha/beta fold hydrolase [Candidatus Omnitrophota bacterium]